MKKRMIGLVLAVMTLLTFGFAEGSASAHAMPSSVVSLDFHEDNVTAELVLPLDRLEIAFGQPLSANPSEVLTNYGKVLSAYVVEHVHPAAADGRAWSVEVQDMSLQLSTQPYDLIVKLKMTPPEGASADAFTFHYDVIVHQLVTHSVLVSVRSDWNHGVFASTPQLIGTIRGTDTTLAIDRSGGSWWVGFKDVVRMGMAHIAEGTDHLLFLLVLLLPAPILAKGGRWAEFGGIRRSLVRLLRVVTAFTIGHSITLAAGALGWVHAPQQAVEVLIAFSILVSAVHALRPIFPGREGIIAMLFGLVHGMAFAALIGELGISRWQMAASIFGFNVGIECMQLIVIAVTVPWLMMLGVTRAFPFVRITGACLAAAASLAWMSERITQAPNRFSALVDTASEHAYWLIAVLAAAALATTAWKAASSIRLKKEAQQA